jgi:hypothetical protein
MKSNFALIPFAADNSPTVRVTGNIERRENWLIIAYKLTGSSNINLPQTAAPTRQLDLWEHTCCEFFLGLKDSTQYWEFNLSPAGHWNVFRFLDYRQNLIEETSFDSLPFSVSQQNDTLQLDLAVNLEQIISFQQNLEINITAVIEDREKQLSYWALTHSRQKPDFHNRDSFVINI